MKKFIGIYLVIAVVVGIYLDIWGMFAYRGFAYNLGRALFWPVLMFSSLKGIVMGVILIAIMVWLSSSRKS